jgi:Caspase domain
VIPAGEAARARCWSAGGAQCRRAFAPSAGLKPTIAALVTLMLAAGVLPAEAKRVALVIGNDSYQNVTPLRNARADARAVADTLKREGFSVTLKEDVTLKGMKDALRGFKEQTSGGDEAVFYYSGHGVQFEGANYLIPVDLLPQSQAQVIDDAVPLQRVLDDLRDQKTRFALAIVDACRDNPFKGTGRAIGGRGLAPVTAASGQMVLYSAGAGQEALDRLGPTDADPNGVFTRVLIREMAKPGVTADQMLKNVREQVVTLAGGVNHEQVPALYDQSIGDFCFVPGPCREGAIPVPQPDKTPAVYFALLASTKAPQQRQKVEQELWDRLRQSLPKEVLYGFLDGQEGARRAVLGFEPAATKSDGHIATIRSTDGELNSGRIFYDETAGTDYRLDCNRGEYVVVRKFNRGGVSYPEEADRKKGAYIAEPGSGQWSLEQALCELPLRITPLWGLDSIEWTDVGAGFRVALGITWSEPQRSKERFILTRRALSEPTFYGAEVIYGWGGINCASHETRSTGFYEATTKGEIIKVTGNADAWKQIEKNSVAANLYVLLCEH